MILLIESHGFSFFDGIFFFCRPDRRATPGVEGPALHVVLTERSEWRDLSYRLHCHQKRNGKPLMLIKTHSMSPRAGSREVC